MRRMWIPIIVMVAFLAGKTANAGQPGLYGYYTKVAHQETSYMGKYADVVVNVGEDMQLEFTRQTGYRPRLKTPGGTYMVEDLYPDRDIDSTFKYTYARLVKNTSGEVVVHWRHYPYYRKVEQKDDFNPTAMEGLTGVVHEIFRIYPNGKVIREVKEAGGTKYYQWKHPDYKTTQTLHLTANGVDHGAVDPVCKSNIRRQKTEGRPVRQIEGPSPVFYCSFDEGMNTREDVVADQVSGATSKIYGPTSMFRKGVSGTALAFDGYYTQLNYTPDLINFEEEMSVQAWVALDAYPYNDTPIIHNSNGFGREGFYFGVDPYGHLLMRVNGTTVKSTSKLPLWKWASVSATIGDGEITLYVNNQQVASGEYDREGIFTPYSPVMVGYNSEKSRGTDYVRTPKQNLKYYSGIQGLIDEVRVYDEALDEGALEQVYASLEPADRKSSLDKGVLPGNVGPSDEFGATYKTTELSPIWDGLFRLSDYADVVVKFDNNPGSVVYWHGTNYAANWVSDNNRWMSDQSAEIWGPHGCSEHMADKQLRHSRVRVIENNPARVVIHWRYPSPDISYHFMDQKHWTDEYHVIYPEGYGIRKLYWNGEGETPGFEDVQYLTNPGEDALDVVHLKANIVANLEGEVQELTWEKPRFNPEITLDNASIRLNNSKSEYKNYVIYNGSKITTWGRHENSKYTDDPFAGPWNHWPVHLLPSDGRFAVDNDRVTHFALGASDAAPRHGAMVIYGLTNQSVKNLVPLAKSWRYPPKISDVSGAARTEYVQEQRAYHLEANAESVSFTLEGSSETPVHNPAFVIENWNSGQKPAVEVDGSRPTGEAKVRSGIERDANGHRKCVVWIDHQAQSEVQITISGARQ